MSLFSHTVSICEGYALRHGIFHWDLFLDIMLASCGGSAVELPALLSV